MQLQQFLKENHSWQIFIHSVNFMCFPMQPQEAERTNALTLIPPLLYQSERHKHTMHKIQLKAKVKPIKHRNFQKQEGTSDSKKFYPQTDFKDCEDVPTTIISFKLDSKTYQRSSTISWKNNPHTRKCASTIHCFDHLLSLLGSEYRVTNTTPALLNFSQVPTHQSQPHKIPLEPQKNQNLKTRTRNLNRLQWLRMCPQKS